MKILTKTQSRHLDDIAINKMGIPGKTLMGNAGNEVAQLAMEMLSDIAGSKVGIFCGKGNNGGDGYKAGLELHKKAIFSTLFVLPDKDQITGDARLYYDQCAEAGCNIIHTEDPPENESFDLIVDGILGTGSHGELVSPLREVTKWIKDDKEIADLIAHFLKEEGYEVRSAYSSRDALTLLQQKQADILVTDIRMPDMNGIELIREVNHCWPDTVSAIVITAYSDIEVATEAIRLGVADFLLKPIDPAAVKLAIKSVQDRWRLRRGLRLANEDLKTKIDECQKAVKATRESNLMLERIAEGVGDGVLLLDRDFTILWANRKEAEQIGYDREEAHGNREFCIYTS